MTISKYYIRKSSTNYLLLDFTMEKEGNKRVDSVPFEVSKSNSANLDIGDDVSIGYMSGSFVTEFAGDIVGKSVNETGKYILESYGGRLNRSDHFSDIYNDKSPEYIMEDVINNQVSSLTYASTAASGVTINEFVVKDETPAEVADRLIKLTNWQIRTDNSKNFYFEPLGTTTNSTHINIGTNASMTGVWNYVPGSIINSLTLKGGPGTFNTSESFTATASQTTFNTSEKIAGNVKVTVNGTEKTGGVEGSVATYDYTVSSDNKEIVFESGLTVGDAVIIHYDYQIPIKITAKNDASIASNGTFSRKMTEKNIITMNDARKRANQILSTYSELSRSATIYVNYNSDYAPGETVRVIDSFNSIDQQLVIRKMILKYPDGTKTVDVGTPQLDLYAWQKGIDDRLRILEQQQDNSDKIQQYRMLKESINVTERVGRVKVRTDTLGNSTILDSGSNGQIGVNSDTQGGEQQVIGEDSRIETIEYIVNPSNTMYERFNFNTYIDTGSTTGALSTTNENIVLDPGEHVTSKSVALNDTDFSKATMAVTSTNGSDDMTLKMSINGGSNWEAVSDGTEYTFTNVGKELQWYVGNNSASGAGFPTAFGTWGSTSGATTNTVSLIKIEYT